MSIHIHKFLKDDLSELSEMSLSDVNYKGMTVSHYACSTITTEATIPFTITGEEKHVVYMEDIDFMVSFKETVDATAIGSNGTIRKNTGKDVGRENYKNSNPSRPLDLPPGFKEVYKE